MRAGRAVYTHTPPVAFFAKGPLLAVEIERRGDVPESVLTSALREGEVVYEAQVDGGVAGPAGSGERGPEAGRDPEEG